MEHSSGFVLQTESGQQVGFILGSPSFSASSGDCVFMLLPAEPKLVDSALGVALAERKAAGEHQWLRQGGRVQVLFYGASVLEINEFGEVINSSGEVLGVAVPLPVKAR